MAVLYLFLFWQVTIDEYSVQQHMEIIKLFYRNGCSVRAMFHALRPFYDRHNRPTDRSRSVYRSKIIGQRLPTSFGLNWMIWIPRTCGFNRTALQHEQFEGIVISRGGDVNWPWRSCDLTLLDCVLWFF